MSMITCWTSCSVAAGGNRQFLRLVIIEDDQDIIDLMLLMTRTVDGALAALAKKKRASCRQGSAGDEKGRIKRL
ncbi:hypothetical protein EFD56_21220 [Rhizobium phaseoli]|uniref:hypothetical protein n=1 Tax=Rhizobium phaseoli TaxID=396 RepID=UPI000F87EA77|nr:hypothetical protein [Rhizobium phaseoli]RUM16841.1 hypothetical protein EFD56_21220 [Rhizobium phaseoli]